MNVPEALVLVWRWFSPAPAFAASAEVRDRVGSIAAIGREHLRAARTAVDQRLFAPAARLYGQICAAVRAAGRESRRRASDLMIAATAASNQLPLYTANPDDFKGAESFVEVIGIRARPNNL